MGSVSFLGILYGGGIFSHSVYLNLTLRSCHLRLTLGRAPLFSLIRLFIKAPPHSLAITRDTHNSEREKSSGKANLFNIWTSWAMERTSAQPQVNLTFFRSNSLKFQPLFEFTVHTLGGNQWRPKRNLRPPLFTILPPVKTSLTPLVLITNFKRILNLYTVYTVYLHLNIGTRACSNHRHEDFMFVYNAHGPCPCLSYLTNFVPYQVNCLFAFHAIRHQCQLQYLQCIWEFSIKF